MSVWQNQLLMETLIWHCRYAWFPMLLGSAHVPMLMGLGHAPAVFPMLMGLEMRLGGAHQHVPPVAYPSTGSVFVAVLAALCGVFLAFLAFLAFLSFLVFFISAGGVSLLFLAAGGASLSPL